MHTNLRTESMLVKFINQVHRDVAMGEAPQVHKQPTSLGGIFTATSRFPLVNLELYRSSGSKESSEGIGESAQRRPRCYSFREKSRTNMHIEFRDIRIPNASHALFYHKQFAFVCNSGTAFEVPTVPALLFFSDDDGGQQRLRFKFGSSTC